MKKTIWITILSLTVTGNALAEKPRHNPACKPLMEHMRTTHPQIEAAIKANDAQKVGQLVIADHNFIEKFIAEHPQCKPRHFPK